MHTLTHRASTRLTHFAHLPHSTRRFSPACFEAPKERARVKLVLANQEHVHPSLFSSLQRAMKPLMSQENSKFLGLEDAKAGKKFPKHHDFDDDDDQLPVLPAAQASSTAKLESVEE